MTRRTLAALAVASLLAAAGCSSASPSSSTTPTPYRQNSGGVYVQVSPAAPAPRKKIEPTVVEPTAQELRLTQTTLPVRGQYAEPAEYTMRLFAYLHGRAKAAGIVRQVPLRYAFIDRNQVVKCGEYQMAAKPFSFCYKNETLLISPFDLDVATQAMRGDNLGVLFNAMQAYSTYLVSPTGSAAYHQCLIGVLIRATQNDGAISYQQALGLVAFEEANSRYHEGHTVDGWYNLGCKP